MMLAHSASVTQATFYAILIRRLAKGDETTRNSSVDWIKANKDSSSISDGVRSAWRALAQMEFPKV
jgi:hypothetical protein